MSKVKSITEAEIDALVNGPKPVLIDVWATWCGPCKSLAPVLEEVAEEMGDRAEVVKVEVEDAPNFTSQYGVRAVPTCLIFKDGQVEESIQGAQPKAKYVSALTELL